MPQSHTSTQEWQSFEMRMRRRRADRCVLRASAALEAHLRDAAREALDEARALYPDHPQLPELAARIDAPASLPAARRREPARAWAAVAALVLLSAAAGWFWVQSPTLTDVLGVNPAEASLTLEEPPLPVSQPSDPPVDELATTAAEPDAAEETAAPPAAMETVEAASAGGTGSAPVPSEPVTEKPAGTAGLRASAEPVADRPTPRTPTPTPRLPAAGASRSSDASLVTPTRPLEIREERTLAAAVPPPSLPEVPLAGAPLASTSVGTPPAPPAVRPSASPAPSPPAPVSDERRVRAALDRYQMAYSQLDAAAARAVWPTVDTRALERAFGGLESQSITLGQCSVRVNGGSAQADCTGNARWTPRVGGGAQASARRWRFDLQNDRGEWVIVDANVR